MSQIIINSRIEHFVLQHKISKTGTLLLFPVTNLIDVSWTARHSKIGFHQHLGLLFAMWRRCLSLQCPSKGPEYITWCILCDGGPSWVCALNISCNLTLRTIGFISPVKTGYQSSSRTTLGGLAMLGGHILLVWAQVCLAHGWKRIYFRSIEKILFTAEMKLSQHSVDSFPDMIGIVQYIPSWCKIEHFV